MDDINGLYKEVGEIRGQMRELIHSTNSNSQKLDAIGVLAATLPTIVENVAKHDGRITVLETAENKRQGAVGLLTWFSHHWPWTIIIAAGIAVWHFFVGKAP